MPRLELRSKTHQIRIELHFVEVAKRPNHSLDGHADTCAMAIERADVDCEVEWLIEHVAPVVGPLHGSPT